MSENDMLRFLSIKVVDEQNLSLLLDLKLLFLKKKTEQETRSKEYEHVQDIHT